MRRPTILMLFASFIGMSVVLACAARSHEGTTQPTTMPTRMIGSGLTVEEAIRQSAFVLVGRVTAVSKADVGPSGAVYYSEIKFSVTRLLLGDEHQSPGTAAAIRRVFPEDSKEMPPTVGETYILFVAGGPNTRIWKLLPSDSATVEFIERLVSKAKP